MSVSRKHRSIKKSSKSSKRSKNVRSSKKTRKHIRKMRGGNKPLYKVNESFKDKNTMYKITHVTLITEEKKYNNKGMFEFKPSYYEYTCVKYNPTKDEYEKTEKIFTETQISSMYKM